MIDAFVLAQLPRRSLVVRMGPARPRTCAIGGCPVDEHSYAVMLPERHGIACTNCASEHFELDWSKV